MKVIANPLAGEGLQFINEDGTPGAGIVVKGAYNASTDYAVGDSISYLGSSYVMYIDAIAGTLPTDTTKWQVLANKGETGATGSSITGPTGPPGADGPNNITTSTTTNLTGFLKGNGSVVSADNSTYSTDIHSNITALNAVTNTNTGDQTSSNFDIKDLTDSTNLRTSWTGKQSALSEGTDYLNKTHLDAAYAPVSVVNYTLPTSSTSVLGGVKVGDRLSINTGVLSADVQTTDISGKVDKVTGSRLITSAESTLLGNTSGTNTGNETVTTIKTALGITTLSGSNTGDQDLSGYELLSNKQTDLTASATKYPTVNAVNTGLATKQPTGSYLVASDITGKLDANAPITGATKTKITYDADGLVTSGADATTADIADSTNKRYVNDAQLVVIGNTSGTNSGNQDLSGYAPLASPSLTGTPAAPTAGAGTSTTQLATTEFVQVAVRSSPGKEASEYATIAALPAIVYANGSSGVGATLTGVAVGALGVDSQSPAVGNRILVKNQVSTFQNGIYTVTATGSGIAVFVLTRALDFNQQTDILTGAATYVVGGTTLAATTWDVNSADSPVMGTDAITFVQSAGPGSVVQGNGITITGTSIAINTAVTADLSSTQSLINKTIDGVTPTVMGYVDPTSSIQTQLNSKQATGSYLTTVDISANTNLAVSAPIVLTGDTLSIPAATASVNGYATSTQITKLDGIATGAEVNVNADWNSSSGDSQISNKPTLGTAAAKNIPATGDASATEVVYGSDTRLTNARTPSSTLTHAATHVTGSTDVIASAVAAGNAGLMIGTDKTKLDGITASATANAKISAATLDTGSDDTGFVTALSVASSHNVPHVVPSTAGKILTSDGTDWTSSAPTDVPITTSTTTNLTGFIKGDGSNISADTLDISWTAVTYENNWVNFSGVYPGARYTKDDFGIIHLDGLTKSGTVGAVPIFTLPVGYRPTYDSLFAIASNSLFGLVHIYTNGVVAVITGNNTWVSLAGISFTTN